MPNVAWDVIEDVLKLVTSSSLGSVDYNNFQRLLVAVNDGAALGENDPKLYDRPETLLRKTKAVFAGKVITVV